MGTEGEEDVVEIEGSSPVGNIRDNQQPYIVSTIRSGEGDHHAGGTETANHQLPAKGIVPDIPLTALECDGGVEGGGGGRSGEGD